ncbi:hypothetical protein LZ32DRAFT_609898 [Colletotrichum eremochloae]|nr:hypothetical protein LZ32DRAFT_609898 [Colletotrichum eremochloae]
MAPSMEQLQEIFQPHQFGINEQYVNLYHVYDDLSRTPYQHGIGIECEDPDIYFMNAWHVITPSAIGKHLNWCNKAPTQFMSFYNNLKTARCEQYRRCNQTYVHDVGYRRPESVRIAHVRLPRNTNVWAFLHEEMLGMMGTFGAGLEMSRISDPSELFVWWGVPDECVQNRHLL